MKTIREMMDLSGRVAAVTGGAGKIGEAFCETLAELGATVCIVDVSKDAADSQCQKMNQRQWPGKCLYMIADISREDDVDRVAKQVADTCGRLDILVNNAAYPVTSLPSDGLQLEQQTLSRWNLNLQVMLTGAFLMTRACAPMLRVSGHGVIVNTGSIYGLIGPDFRLYEGTEMQNPAFYAAAKGAILQLTRHWATTLAPSVRVNAVVPGGVWRNQPESFHERYRSRTPLGRMAIEEDLKGALAFLASDLSAYVTGQATIVDGGFTAW